MTVTTFSVITASYNRVGTLAQALDSVQGQQGVTVEHIVIDGGSTDGSLELLRSRPVPPAVLVSEPDGGIYDALNKGLQRATGSVIGFLHSDDWLTHPRVLERVAAAFAQPGVEAVYGDLDYVSADGGRVIRQWRSGAYEPGKLAAGWMPPHPTLYLRREVYQRLGGFDTSLRIAADYEFMLRLLTEQKKVTHSFSEKGVRHLFYVPEVLVKMRWGGASNRSLGRLIRKSREDLIALRRHGVGGLGTLLRKNLSKLPQFLKW